MSKKVKIRNKIPSLLQHFAWLPLRIFHRFRHSLEIEGIENIQSIKGNVIIASNHSSELDPLLIVACLPFFSKHLPLCFVSRERSFYPKNWRRFMYGGKFFELMGAYPAYSGKENYKQALPYHLEAIKKGFDICIFPVGKKHDLIDYNNARGGVSFLSKETNTSVIPVLITGFKHHKNGANSRLIVKFGKAIHPKELFTDDKLVSKNLNKKDYEKASAIIMKKIHMMN